ncbi:MAG: diguanylate cyclase [Microthrixaceae bacterium]
MGERLRPTPTGPPGGGFQGADDRLRPSRRPHPRWGGLRGGATDGYHIATRLRLLHDDGTHVDRRVTATTVERADGTWFVLGVRSVGEEDAIESRRRKLRALATTFYVDCASMEWMDAPERSRALLAGLGAVLDAEGISIARLDRDAGELVTVASWRNGTDRDAPAEGDRRPSAGAEGLAVVPCDFRRDAQRVVVEAWLSSTNGENGVVRIDLGDHPEQWDDANADVVSLMCSSLMATVRRCSRERAVAMAATRDPLTGLLNRAAMQERLEELITVSSIGGETLSVFFADLNDFKALNDSAGHHAGDEVLCNVADALRGAIRPGDLAARVGGDEFVVVMMSRRRSTEKLTRRLREAVEAAIDPATGVGLAIGAISVRAGDRPEEILARADAAMYEDKRRGRAGRPEVPQAEAETGPRLSAAMESLSVMLAVDSRARLLTATQAAYSVFGFEPDSSMGVDVLQMVHPEDRALAAAAFERVRREPGRGEPVELRVLDADGGSHEVEVVANNQLDNPVIAGIVMTLNDARPVGGGLGGDGGPPRATLERG